MAAPQHILYGVGNTVAIDIPTRPAATQTVSCYSGSGAAIFSAQTGVLSTISTTLSSAAAARATTVAVASATGISAGLEFWIRTPNEKVRCKTISGTTVTLWQPLLYAHASGSTAQGTRITYAVTAAQAATLFWDGRLEWLIDDTAGTETLHIQAACCSKYPFHLDQVTEQDLWDEDSKIGDLIDAEADTQRLILKGSGDVLKRLNALTQARAFSYIGDLSDAVVLACKVRIYQNRAGDENERLWLRYREMFKEEIDLLVAGTVYRDADQDSAVEQTEQISTHSVQLLRS